MCIFKIISQMMSKFRNMLRVDKKDRAPITHDLGIFFFRNAAFKKLWINMYSKMLHPDDREGIHQVEVYLCLSARKIQTFDNGIVAIRYFRYGCNNNIYKISWNFPNFK